MLRGGFQNDRLEGRGGNDLIMGQAGRDFAIGGLDKDRCHAEMRVSCELKIGTGDPVDDDPTPTDPGPLSWVLDKFDTSRDEGKTCSFDNCQSFENAGKMSAEGTYIQTHTQLAKYGDPSSGLIINAQFNVQFTPPPAQVAPGQRVTLETSGSATGFVNLGGQRMVFFYRATTNVFAPEPDAKPTSTDSPETLLILEGNHTSEIKAAATNPTFVAPSTSLATFSISAIGLNFASITWTYKVKVNPNN